MFILNFKQAFQTRNTNVTKCSKTPGWNVAQVGWLVTGDNSMIGHERGILNRLSHSQARMGRASTLHIVAIYFFYVMFYTASTLQCEYSNNQINFHFQHHYSFFFFNCKTSANLVDY